MRTAVGQNSSDEMLAVILNRCGKDTPITEAIIATAAETGDKRLNLLFDHWGNEVEITEFVVEQAVLGSERLQVLRTIYRQKGADVPIEESVWDAVWKQESHDVGDASNATVMLLLDLWEDIMPLNPALVRAIARLMVERDRKIILIKKLNHWHSNDSLDAKNIAAVAKFFDEEVVRQFLDKLNTTVQITRDIVTAIKRNRGRENMILWLFLGRLGDDCILSEEVLAEIASSFDEEILRLFFDKWNGRVLITEQVVMAGVRNPEHALPITTLFLDRCGKRSPITELVVESAVRHPFCEEAVMELLLDRLEDNVPVTEYVVEAAIQSEGNAVIPLLLSEGGRRISFTESMVILAIMRRDDGNVLQLIIDRQGDNFTVTEKMLLEVATSTNIRIIRLVLDRTRRNMEITGSIIEAIAHTRWNGRIFMELLTDRLGSGMHFTKEAVELVARYFDTDLTREVLVRIRMLTEIAEAVVIGAAGQNSGHGKATMTLLLNRLQDGRITNKMAIEAAKYFDRETVARILHRSGRGEELAKVMMEAGAGSDQDGHGIVKLLLDYQGENVSITEGVIKAAAGGLNGHKVLALLSRHIEEDVQITEDIMKAAVGSSSAWKVLDFIATHWGKDMPITEAVMEQAVIQSIRNRGEALEFLFDHGGKSPPLSDSIFDTAARLEPRVLIDGEDIMLYLLKRRRLDIPMTEGIVKAAVRSPVADRVLTLIIHRWGENVPITEDVLRTATECGNGGGMLRLALKRWETHSIKGEVLMEVAAESEDGQRNLELILQRLGNEVSISEEIVKAAARNPNGPDTLKYICRRWGEQVRITEEILRAAATNKGGEHASKFLVQRYGKEILVSEEMWPY